MSVMEHMQAAVASTILRISPVVAQRLIRRPIVIDDQTLDPHLQILLQLQRRSGRGGFETLGGDDAARREYRRMVGVLERSEAPAPITHDRRVETAAASVPVRVYKPRAAKGQPAIVYFHGGGFVIGDLETHDGFCRRLCRECDAVVIAVDYRLAPEHPFPAAVQDAVAVTQWVLEEAAELGVDSDRVAVAGDSAGGNLALNVSVEVEGICFALPIYPSADNSGRTPSQRRFGHGFGLDQTTVDWFMERYARNEDPHHRWLSPLLSKDLQRCPPTHVAIAGYDVLRDEGLALAERLVELGVSATHKVYPGLTHGFVHFTRISSANEAVAELTRVLWGALHA